MELIVGRSAARADTADVETMEPIVFRWPSRSQRRPPLSSYSPIQATDPLHPRRHGAAMS